MTNTFSPEFLARVPKSDRQHRALIQKLGIREPRPGRPRKGERSRHSTPITLRLPDAVLARVERLAARKGTTVARLGQRFYTELALS